MFNFSRTIISLFGIGFSPWAPGTIASFFSIIFFYLIKDYLSLYGIIIIFIITFFLSVRCINTYSKIKNEHDSKEIVIDEFLGINFIMIFYDYLKFSKEINSFILIFVIFRFFDIYKIFPANWIDKNLNNSWGVLLDDIVAGIFTIITIYGLNVFL